MGIEILTEDEGSGHLRQLRVDGERASRLWVLDRDIRLAGATVSMAGIGGVRTEPQHRKKGYMRRLMEDTVSYMTDRGYAVSMLFGISDFYNRFGYLPALPEHHLTIATRDAERARSELQPAHVRPLIEEDYPFVFTTGAAADRDRPASVIRDAGTFRGFHRGTGWDVPTRAFIMEAKDGEPSAYFALDDRADAMRVTDLGATARAVHPLLLRHLARTAVQRRCGEMEVHAPPDHPFVEFMRRFGCVSHVRHHRMGGGMMRILNQDRLFEAIRPGLAERLRRGPMASSPVRLRLETGLGVTDLRLNADARGREVSASIGLDQDVLTQLVVGYRTVGDVLADRAVRWDGEAHAVAGALFDGRPCPYAWYADRF